MTIETINPNQCAVIREKLSTAIAAVEEELGLVIKMGKMSYTAETVGCKMDIRLNGSDSPEIKALKEYIVLFDLPEDLTTRELVIDNLRCRVTGCNPKARRNHFIIETLEGSATYVCPVHTIRKALSANSIA